MNVKNTNKQYPRLCVNLDKLSSNISKVVKKCEMHGISLCGVVKGFNGLGPAVNRFIEEGCSQIGTSRIQQIIALKEEGYEAEMLLLRIPMASEVEKVAEYADISLNSELEILTLLNEAAAKTGKKHGVILMADLGDLREGFWNKDELVSCAETVENKLTNLVLRGVGTNLGCYGSIKPDRDKMEQLIECAEMVEKKIGRKLEIVSGGATTSYPLLLSEEMPEGINHLRIGEGIICAYDLPNIWNLKMDDFYDDVFIMEAEVVEVKDKPTHPVGEIFVDAFGRKPVYEDRGIRKRAVIAAGKLDFALNDKIFPMDNSLTVIGSSSDHLILDVDESAGNLKPGDIVQFKLSYPSLMYLSNDKYVDIEYIGRQEGTL